MSPRTLENWRWKGRGPEFLKIGGKVMYDLNDIEAYEREQKRQQSSVDLAPSLLEDAT
jgi:hypothetical protein